MAWDAPRPLPGSTLESRTTFPGSRTSSQVGSALAPLEGQLPQGRQLQGQQPPLPPTAMGIMATETMAMETMATMAIIEIDCRFIWHHKDLEELANGTFSNLTINHLFAGLPHILSLHVVQTINKNFIKI